MSLLTTWVESKTKETLKFEMTRSFCTLIFNVTLSTLFNVQTWIRIIHTNWSLYSNYLKSPTMRNPKSKTSASPFKFQFTIRNSLKICSTRILSLFSWLQPKYFSLQPSIILASTVDETTGQTSFLSFSLNNCSPIKLSLSYFPFTIKSWREKSRPNKKRRIFST